jgi:hypothetical protein
MFLSKKALKPDPGTEHEFEVENNKLTFSAGTRTTPARLSLSTSSTA